ncbi:MAG: pilus assembly protein [Solirubrobacterales bacterium]|nr:pilus assembly protein [Solirubrobacterales bacterium]
MVEFAVVLPVLVIIILGILYLGRYEDYSNQMTQLAEQGARYAAVDQYPSTSTNLQAWIESAAQGELNANSGSKDVSALQAYVYCVPSASQCQQASQVRVCLVSTMQLWFLSIGRMTVTTPATMRVEATQQTSPSGGTGWSTTNNSNSTVPSSCPTT